MKKKIIEKIALEMMEIDNAKYMPDTNDIIPEETIIEEISLLDNLEDVDREGRTLLINAAFYDRLKIVEYLIGKNVNINAADKDYFTALHAAAMKCNIEIMEILLKAGADVNAKNVFGNNPIMAMILSGRTNIEAYKLLMKYGADPSIKNIAGNSAIDIAVISQKTEIASILRG